MSIKSNMKRLRKKRSPLSVPSDSSDSDSSDSEQDVVHIQSDCARRIRCIKRKLSLEYPHSSDSSNSDSHSDSSELVSE